MENSPKVSLILTVLNEGQSVRALLDSIAAQTRLPDEIVVCDGGSRDDTVAILRNETRLNIRVIETPGANISRGRNQAIAEARHDIVACTDAGVRLDRRWLEKLLEPFAVPDFRSVSASLNAANEANEIHQHSKIENSRDLGKVQQGQGQKSAVAGFFLPDPHTPFEMAMSATVLPLKEEIDPATFLPSSRSVAFTKRAWQEVGGYPEWLDYCEDLIFDLKLRERVGAFAFAPDAIAYFRPRGSLHAFFKQYYLYARGDGKAGLFFKRHLIRYATYLLALPVMLVGIVGGPTLIKATSILALLAGVVVYMRAPYRRFAKLAKNLPISEKMNAAGLIPTIRVIGDLAKMTGYPAGLVWRWKNKSATQP